MKWVLTSDQSRNDKLFEDGRQLWSGTWNAESKVELDWNVQLDPDPGISGPVVVTNNFAVPATFNLFMLLPTVGVYPAGSTMFGSSSITVGDSNFDSSASLSTIAGSAVYNALADGVVQRQLYSHVYSLVPAFGPPGSTNSETRAFSGELTTSALTTEIGIRHHFTLSPGDSATINSSFFIVAEPSACLLGLASIAVVVATVRRRGR
ncbi:MAG: hypothetical protein IT427_10305 [Pirellulales bacterium]|nr:hypothetical protein [Pirellulales bacterium]